MHGNYVEPVYAPSSTTKDTVVTEQDANMNQSLSMEE